MSPARTRLSLDSQSLAFSSMVRTVGMSLRTRGLVSSRELSRFSSSIRSTPSLSSSKILSFKAASRLRALAATSMMVFMQAEMRLTAVSRLPKTSSGRGSVWALRSTRRSSSRVGLGPVTVLAGMVTTPSLLPSTLSIGILWTKASAQSKTDRQGRLSSSS